MRLPTSEALAIAGVGRIAWADAVSRGHVTDPPELTGTDHGGRVRMFDRDDVVALFVADYFRRLGVAARLSWQIASRIRVELRKHAEIEAVWVMTTARGRPVKISTVEPSADAFRVEIPIGRLRRETERLIAERFTM